MWITVRPDLQKPLPRSMAPACGIDGLTVEDERPNLQALKWDAGERTKRTYRLATVKNASIFRTHRVFSLRAGMPHKKMRPASEVLVLRALAGRPFPTIGTLPDSYNLAPTETATALAVFDADKPNGDLALRCLFWGEKFVGMGMENAMDLSGDEPVLSDGERLVTVDPSRDGDQTKVTTDTDKLRVPVCGSPEMQRKTIEQASRVALYCITRFCGGIRWTS